jgi:hypothetical protein
VWGTNLGALDGTNIVWGTATMDRVLLGGK